MNDTTRVITCSIDPAEPLVCGEMATRTLQIEVQSPIRPGGRIRFYFTRSPYYRRAPVYGLMPKGFVFFPRIHFQTGNAAGPGYLTATANSEKALRIEIQPNRSFFTLICPEGLEPGDRVQITIGDRRGGGPGSEVAHHPTYGDWQLLCEVDAVGDIASIGDTTSTSDESPIEGGNFIPQAGMPSMRVVTAPPSQVLVRTPSQAQPGKPLDLHITVTDNFGNPVEEYQDSFAPSLGDPDAKSWETAGPWKLNPADTGAARFPGSVTLAQEGIHRLTIRSLSDAGPTLHGASNPVLCATKAPDYRIFWGDLHGHSVCSDGTYAPEFFYHFGREVGFLDFCSLTDHDCFSQETWQEMIAIAQQAYQPGRFTTFLGYEWGGDLDQTIVVYHQNGAGGYYPGPDQRSHRAQELIALLRQENGVRGNRVMVVRHDMPLPGHRWQPVDATGEMERLVEIHSPFHTSELAGVAYARGSLDEGNSIQAALADGLRFGFVACSDTHISMPGRRQSVTKGHAVLGTAGNRTPRLYGLTAVYARENTREAIFQALYDRRCYAATDRILLDFHINDHPMGSVLPLAEPRQITALVGGTAPFTQVEIVKNNQVLYSAGQGTMDITLEYTDITDIRPGDYYYIRVIQQDGGLAWSSPIWIHNSA